VLDPHISCEGLKIDYSGDLALSTHLKDSKTSLFDYFDENYATLPSPTPSSPPSTSVQALPPDGSPQKCFTAQYCRKEKCSTNKLEEYFKLPTEDFGTCNPIQWWMGCRSQFLCLFQLASDVLCIPGKWIGHFTPRNSNLNCLNHRFCRCGRKNFLRWPGHHISPTC
jgi:hypothetical protein